MTSIADGSVKIQTTSESNISTPAWFGEIVVISSYLQKHKVLNKINCPANQELRVQEQRREADSSLRVVYAASIRSCRLCPKRAQCQWNGNATGKPRQVSVLLHPLAVGSEPLLWHDWSRRVHRLACMQLLRHQQVMVLVQSKAPTLTVRSAPLSRAERAHARLSWETRLARNASTPGKGR